MDTLKELFIILKKPFEAVGASAREEIYSKFSAGLTKLGVLLWEGLAYIAPDLIGMGAFVTGGWVIVNGMVGKDFVKPMVYYFAGTIVLASLLYA